MHIRFHISDFFDFMPHVIQRVINRKINKIWPVWGYHTNSEKMLDEMEKFLNKKKVKWEYHEVKSYYHIWIFDKDVAQEFAKKFNYGW